jgi:hypothetical protein
LTATINVENGKKMLKPKPKFKECCTCDYRYDKGKVGGCVFPNHAPIDSAAVSSCNTGEYSGIEVDEDYVMIKNIERVTIL